MGFDFNILREATQLDFGLQGQIISLIIILISALAITRNTKHLRLILLPLTLGYRVIGIETHPLVMMLFALVWAITLLAAHDIGSTIMSAPGEALNAAKGTASITKKVVGGAWTGGAGIIKAYKTGKEYFNKKAETETRNEIAKKYGIETLREYDAARTLEVERGGKGFKMDIPWYNRNYEIEKKPSGAVGISLENFQQKTIRQETARIAARNHGPKWGRVVQQTGASLEEIEAMVKEEAERIKKRAIERGKALREGMNSK